MMPSTQRLIGSLTLAFTAFVFTPAYAQLVIGIDEKSAAAMQQLIQSAQQHQQAGQWDKAMEATQKLVQLQRDFLPVTASDLAESLAVLGDLQAASGEWQGAERSFQESLQLLSDNLGADDWRTIDARLLLDELKLWQRLSDPQRMQLERSGELQQQQMAQMLSAQTGRYQIMANNDGLSSIIDHKGHIVKSLAPFSSGELKGVVYTATGATPWVNFGNQPIIIFILLLTLLAVIKLLKKDPMMLAGNIQ